MQDYRIPSCCCACGRSLPTNGSWMVGPLRVCRGCFEATTCSPEPAPDELFVGMRNGLILSTGIIACVSVIAFVLRGLLT